MSRRQRRDVKGTVLFCMAKLVPETIQAFSYMRVTVKRVRLTLCEKTEIYEQDLVEMV
jgi:hypothetical protein